MPIPDDGYTTATPAPAGCTCHADYYERELIDPACGLEGNEHHRRDGLLGSDTKTARPICQHTRTLSRDSNHRILTICIDCGAYHEEWGKPSEDAWVLPPALLAAEAEVARLEAEVKRLREAL